MRTLVTAALIAAGVLPLAAPAAAQSRAELQRDRRDIREERRDLRDAQRFGDYRDVRDAREDLRDARQEYREDLRDRRDDRYGGRNWGRNDWRGYRGTHRDLYARGGWRAPFGYTAFRPGARVGAAYYGRNYWIADPGRYRLPRAYGAQRWVRHYDDVLLVDTRRGVVVDAIRGFYF